ncbi:MAG: hypothetical protein Q9179_002615 [Wetmoreana sp. 5 TL-2023]
MAPNTQTQDFLEEGYGLSRGYAPSLRLNFQHQLLRDLLGYSISPDIVVKGNLPPNPKIADVGTGTGQWLVDVSYEISSAQLDGFDISKEQFPSTAWLSPQISFSELDITQSLPSALEGKYDLVHVQLFLCVVRKDNLLDIMKNLYKMLKPGGFLQWVEYDPTSFRVVSPEPSLKQSANDKHIQIIRGPQGIATTWPSELPVHFMHVCFEGVVAKDYPLPPQLYMPFMLCHLCAAEEVSFTAMNNNRSEAEGPSFRKLLAEVYKECQTGVTMTESPMVVIGRKG